MHIGTPMIVICALVTALCCAVGLVDIYFLVYANTSNIYHKYNVGLYVVVIFNALLHFISIFVEDQAAFDYLMSIFPFLVYFFTVTYFFEVVKVFEKVNGFQTRFRVVYGQVAYMIFACVLYIPKFICEFIIGYSNVDPSFRFVISTATLILILTNAVLVYSLNVTALLKAYRFSKTVGQTEKRRDIVMIKFQQVLHYYVPQLAIFTIGVIIYVVNHVNPRSTQLEIALDTLAEVCAKGAFVIALFLYIRSFEKLRELLAAGVQQSKAKPMTVEASHREVPTPITSVALTGAVPSLISGHFDIP